MKVTKVVIPVAGWGTRSLPASKNIPKEMLPIYNKPVVQYVVEEAIGAGIKDVVFITNRDKSVIEDHFDYNLQLESVLERTGKKELLALVRSVAEMANCIAVRQKKQLGLGHAVLCARDVIGDNPFAAMVGDDLLFGESSGLEQLLQVARKEQLPVVGVMEVPEKQVSSYGIISGSEIADGIYKIDRLVEKPAIEDAPSNLAIIGRYVLTPDIFEHLAHVKPGHGGEIQLTDALQELATARGMLAVKIKGSRYDVGNWVDYLCANVLLGLRDPSIKDTLLPAMESMLIQQYRRK